ncbi:hypothetical protein M431DRAFT_281926 [Trichoderma harzianum CBS 226.95]|uniref:Uncharacterized protein n=1 Tax=Trichoderma harzianum CBS 226.95 TaxID=983964 RepID=A0A2T4ANJ4_TRIHA|nr:hypothetical protein M431DRAFT_281926 [Trichoderma harzianum CBS 226.95]PTB58637.1 hypothetical protein M431DRAFT_281926 [Trichoderma harzianum CBS 226.95]
MYLPLTLHLHVQLSLYRFRFQAKKIKTFIISHSDAPLASIMSHRSPLCHCHASVCAQLYALHPISLFLCDHGSILRTSPFSCPVPPPHPPRTASTPCVSLPWCFFSFPCLPVAKENRQPRARVRALYVRAANCINTRVGQKAGPHRAGWIPVAPCSARGAVRSTRLVLRMRNFSGQDALGDGKD